MARQCNGTSDLLTSASALSLNGVQTFALSFWLYHTNAYDTADHFAFQYGIDAPTGSRIRFFMDPDYFTGNGVHLSLLQGSAAGASVCDFTQPSSAAWHHFVINVDMTQSISSWFPSVYVDAVSQTLNNTNAVAATSLDNETLYVGADGASSTNFLACQLADWAIYSGINLSQTDATNLHNGNLPPTVQGGSLVYYWKICGAASPEPAAVGGINLTVTGTIQTNHPSAITASCAAGPTLGLVHATSYATRLNYPPG